MTLGRTNCFRALAALGDERPVAVKSEQLARPSRLAMGIVRAFATCAMLLAGIGSLAYALTGSFWKGEREAVAASIIRTPSVKRLVTAPIETIRLGQRVLAGAHGGADALADSKVDHVTWRCLKFRLTAADRVVEVELLRSLDCCWSG